MRAYVRTAARRRPLLLNSREERERRESRVVLRPGFEPGSVAFSLRREATILDLTILPELE